jgi:polysaccharide export outer membrane protein
MKAKSARIRRQTETKRAVWTPGAWVAVFTLLCGPAFSQTPSQAPPVAVAAGANLPTQKLGPNDLIAIAVYGAPEFTRTVRLSEDGDIRLPMLEHRIRAAGLLPVEIEAAIAKSLSAEQILIDPIVTVTVVEYQSRPISVSGAVKGPVTFQASGPVTLLEAINRAGGLSPDAGLEILVSRRGADRNPSGPTRRVTVKALIDDADPQVNLKLLGGEEIRVPEVSRVFIVGNIKKPGSYPMRDASETTVLKMIAVAEGLSPYASKQAYIMRRDDRSGTRQEIRVELQKIMQRKTEDVALAANDILYIPDNSGRRASMTALEKIAGFGTATASGIIIWGRPR